MQKNENVDPEQFKKLHWQEILEGQHSFIIGEKEETSIDKNFALECVFFTKYYTDLITDRTKQIKKEFDLYKSDGQVEKIVRINEAYQSAFFKEVLDAVLSLVKLKRLDLTNIFLGTIKKQTDKLKEGFISQATFARGNKEDVEFGYEMIKDLYRDLIFKIQWQLRKTDLHINEQGQVAYRNEEEKEVEETINTPEFKKLNWTGTPAEFGAIMGKLIDQGYLPTIKDLKTTVSLLHNLFEVIGNEETNVTTGYLYRCFGEKKKIWPNGDFKIPKSDNYSK